MAYNHSMDEQSQLLEQAKLVLDANHKDGHTAPAPGVYPHQWFWDSCFIAIGLRHTDVARAKLELENIIKGQWHNGMIPHMIFDNSTLYIQDRLAWNSTVNSRSPDNIATSGITQPPMLSEAVYLVGQKLRKPERRAWFKKMYPHILAYHQWLYAERDPHNEGLVIQIHPWESGLDNTPPWMQVMHDEQLPYWVRAVKSLKLGALLNLFRNDTHRIPAGQRIDIIDALGLFSNQRILRRKKYDTAKTLKQSLFSIQDLTFNCIFIRANQRLLDISEFIDKQIPEDLLENMNRSKNSLNKLWDPYSGQYYSRDFISHRQLKQQTIATLMPLYAGTITQDQAKQLVRLLENQHLFATNYPIPSVPKSSDWFKPDGYWQGPTWINTNWLIIDGLSRMGFTDHAEALRQSTIELVATSGIYEYYNPLTGQPSGAKDFSWTAALAIDLVNS